MEIENNTKEELKPLLMKWLSHACSEIEKNLDILIMKAQIPRWYVTKEKMFKKHPVTVLYNSQLDKLIFSDTPYWKDIVSFANSSLALKHYTENMVGSAHGMRRHYRLEELFRLALPKPNLIGENQVEVETEKGIEALAEKFLSEISSEKITSRIFWPITGLATPTPIHLGEDIQFRALSVEEKLCCLNFGMIAASYEHEISEVDADWYGLVWSYQGTKFHTVQDFKPEEMNTHSAFQHELLEDFLICGCLINEQAVTHAGGFQHAPSVELGGMFSGGVIGRAVQDGDMRFRFKDEASVMTQSDAVRMAEIWKFIRQYKSSKRGRQLVNAARRVYYSETRMKPEDVLVDLMIAAESLYLDGEDKGELSYRLSLNASLWDSDFKSDQKETFQRFRKAYSLRSKVVHGAEISSSKVSEAVTAIRPKLKKAVLKAIDILRSGSTLPKWDDLLFAPEISQNNLPKQES